MLTIHIFEDWQNNALFPKGITGVIHRQVSTQVTLSDQIQIVLIPEKSQGACFPSSFSTRQSVIYCVVFFRMGY